jgi:hypothetical protein
MTVVASKFARVTNDLYETEPWVTRALMRHFPPVQDRKIWEPAAGNHAIADVLREGGALVCTTDVVTHDRPHNFIFNFFKDTDLYIMQSSPDIITNPPYGKGCRDAARFARLAFQRTNGWIALLLPATFDFGRSRRDLFVDNPRFSFKIALTHRIQWFPGKYGSTQNHAWYVWGPLWQPPPRIFYEGED